MKKEFVPYEQSLSLKELGFDEPCLGFYYKLDDSFLLEIPVISYKENKNSIIDETFDNNSDCITTPIFSQAFRWFREKYNLLASPKINEFHDRFYFTIRATKSRLMKEIILKREINYEEAELECLKKLIEIVKNDRK